MTDTPTIAVACHCPPKFDESFLPIFFHSFFDNWPEDIPLTIYGAPSLGYASSRLTFLHLNEVSSHWREFNETYGNNQQALGVDPAGNYNPQMDACRAAAEVFAFEHATANCEADFLIWLDPRVYTHQSIPRAFLEQLLPDISDLGVLARLHMTWDTSFIILDMRNDKAKSIPAFIANAYTSGEIFQMPVWTFPAMLHQVVLGVRHQLLVRVYSISRGAEDSDNPLINGPLGAYMDFLGTINEQAARRSEKHKLDWNRPEAHWLDGDAA